MGASYLTILGATAMTAVTSCTTTKREYMSYGLYLVCTGSPIEMKYILEATKFILWPPAADKVRPMLYGTGKGGHTYRAVEMQSGEEGAWIAVISKDFVGKFHTFNVKINNKWQGDTPGINARAVGVDGKRVAITDWQFANPGGWESDTRPPLKSPADIIIYGTYHRNFSVSSTSGMRGRGKYLVLAEHEAMSSDKLLTSIDHLIELSVTHVYLLPSFDHASVDETRLNESSCNWGYDSRNYNMPNGSYVTDPYQPAIRVKEFKQMVQVLYKAGVCMITGVVYNHTFNTNEDNFERTVPGYFCRQKEDKALASSLSCGSETASERLVMHKFMVESIFYQIKEYRADGLRFGLVGIRDIETMNEIREITNAVDPTTRIYGEGWAAEALQCPADFLAMRGDIAQIPGVAIFSNGLRDGLRGPVGDRRKKAFLIGVPGGEMGVRFGIVGAIEHP